jgi:uncharacterized SAM-binding protein YcdF (DUF218 family)
MDGTTRARLEEMASQLIAYLAVTDEPAPADIIWGLGSNDALVPRTAAALYNGALAPWLVFSGGKGHRWTELSQPEATLFASVAVASGVPESRIILEDRSTNTGENVIFTLDLLDSRGIDVRSALLITIPPFQRRAAITVETHRPTVRCVNVPPDWGPVADFDDRRLVEAARLCVGEVQRLRDYPSRGFLNWDPAELPREVRITADDAERMLTRLDEPTP